MNLISASLIAVRTIAGGVTQNPIILEIISGSDLV